MIEKEYISSFLYIIRYREGKYNHREDGPAYIVMYIKEDNIEIVIEEGYYKNGQLHRLDGPAEIFYGEPEVIKRENYWINDEWLIKEEWELHPEVIEYKLNQLINKELM